MRVTMFRPVRTAAVALAGAALLASCGSGAGAGAAGLSEADKTRVAEDFRDCLAENGLEGGVNFEENGISIDIGGDTDMEPEELQAIEQECEKLLEALDSGEEMDPEDEARMIDAGPALQKCLQDKGFDVEVDAQGGISSETNDGDEPIDEGEFAIAEDDCIKELLPDLWEKYGEGN